MYKIHVLPALLWATLTGLASDAVATAVLPKGGVDAVSRQRISLESGQGPIVLVFLSARCPCSDSHLQVLADLHRQFAPKGVRFVGVHSNLNETPEETARYFGKAKLPFPVIEDPEQRLADQFGALKTPHAFVVSTSGEVLFRGGVDSSAVAAKAEKHYLRDALAAIVAGRKPEITEARALGCVIQRN